MTLPESMDILCADRPGLAPIPALKSVMAFSIVSGFGHEVAALSK
jgi:hypothetical protein